MQYSLDNSHRDIPWIIGEILELIPAIQVTLAEVLQDFDESFLTVQDN